MTCDLAEYLRSLYSSAANKLQGVIDWRQTWHSTSEKIFGGLTLPIVEKE